MHFWYLYVKIKFAFVSKVIEYFASYYMIVSLGMAVWR